MILTVQRKSFTDNSTQGELLIDGEFFCYTLEPRSDRSKGKPYCIPQGSYPISLETSHRFAMTTPHLQNVPGFSLIEIHPGNYPADTEGCTLVGFLHDTDYVGESRQCFHALMLKLLTGAKIIYLGGPTE